MPSLLSLTQSTSTHGRTDKHQFAAAGSHSIQTVSGYYFHSRSLRRKYPCPKADVASQQEMSTRKRTLLRGANAPKCADAIF